MSEVLRQNDEKIIQLVSLLKKQRSELNFLIDNQETRKERLESAIDKLTRKLSVLTKSLCQRQHIRSNYDNTIKEIEANYQSLVGQSGQLLQHIFEGKQELEEIIDKRTNIEAPLTEKQIVPKNESGKELHELLGGIEGLPFRVLEMQKLGTQNSLEIERTIRNLNYDEKSFMSKPIEKRQMSGNSRFLRQLDKIEEVDTQSDNSDKPRKVKSPTNQSTIDRKKETKMAFQANSVIEENKKLTQISKYNSVFQTSGKNSRPYSNNKERKQWQSPRENYSYNARKPVIPKHQNLLGFNKYNFKNEEKRQSSATRPKIKEKPYGDDSTAGDMVLTTTISKKSERKKQSNKYKSTEKENGKTPMAKINNKEEYINSFLIEIKKQDNRKTSKNNKRSLSDNDTNLWGSKVTKIIGERRPYSATKPIMNQNHQPVKQLERAVIVKNLKGNLNSGGSCRRDKSPSKKIDKIDYLRKIYKF